MPNGLKLYTQSQNWSEKFISLSKICLSSNCSSRHLESNVDSLAKKNNARKSERSAWETRKNRKITFFAKLFFTQNVHPDTWNVAATNLLKHFRLRSEHLQPTSKSDKNLKLFHKKCLTLKGILDTQPKTLTTLPKRFCQKSQIFSLNFQKRWWKYWRTINYLPKIFRRKGQKNFALRSSIILKILFQWKFSFPLNDLLDTLNVFLTTLPILTWSQKSDDSELKIRMW